MSITTTSGLLAAAQLEVARLAAALGPQLGTISAQYEALSNQRSELERAGTDLSLPLSEDIQRESTIAAITRRLKALELLRQPEQAAQAKAQAEYQAAADSLRAYEYTAVQLREQLAAFDRDTRRWEALRDFDRSRLAAELARVVGGNTAVLPYPQLDKIT